MVYWKWHRWKKQERLTPGKTAEFELPETGLLAAINMEFMQYNVSSWYTNSKKYLHDYISKLEVLGDGTEQVKEVSGPQALAHYVADHGFPPPSELNSGSSSLQWENIPLYFGTHLFENGKWNPDRTRLFDLAQFKDTKLEVTNTLTTALCNDAGPRLDIDLLTLEEAPSVPKSYMKTYEYKNFTPTQDAWNKVVTLPTRDKIRRIMVVMERVHTTPASAYDCDIEELIKEYKLMYKEGSIVVYDEDLRDDMQLHRAAQMQGCTTYAKVDARSATRIDSMLGRCTSMVITHSPQADPGAVTSIATDYEDNRMKLVRYASADAYGEMVAKGYLYLDSLIIDDYTMFGEEGWYDPAERAPGQIEFTGTKDDGAIGIVLDVPKDNLPPA